MSERDVIPENPGEGGPPSKKGRGNLKRKVTSQGRKLQDLLKNPDTVREQVQEALRALQDNFKVFAEYHGKFHDSLGGLEAQLSANYFLEAEAKYQGYTILAEAWLAKAESGEVAPMEADSQSSSSEEEPGPHSPGGRGRENAPADKASGNQTGGMDERVLALLEAMSKRMDRFDDYIRKSSNPMVAGTSTPMRTARTPIRGGLPGLSTIVEAEERQETTEARETLGVIQSMAESMRALAERKETSTIIKDTGIRLPKFKMFTFSGEATDYLPFIRAFESQIEARTEDPATCLGQLIEHVKEGTLRERLRFCALESEPSKAYRDANEILKNKYGRHEDLSQAWLNKVARIKTVRTVEELSDFTSLLSNCLVALRAVNQLVDFETKSNLMSLVDKFPKIVKSRWQRKVVDIREDQGRGPSLADLISMLERLYLEKSDPIFGGSLDERSPDRPLHFRQGAAGVSLRPQRINYTEEQVNATSGQENEQRARPTGRAFPYECLCCKEKHPLYRCNTFKDMTPIDRLKLVETVQACKNCFHPKHAVSDCRSEHRCHVCRNRHHTMLHIDAMERTEYNCNNIVATTLARGKVALPVVPVKVVGPKGEKIIYALLDQGSTCTLCTTRLVDQIGAPTRPYRGYMSTVHGKSVPVDTTQTDFDIVSLANSKKYRLDDVVTKPTLNISARCRAYGDEIAKWEHLRDLDLPTADVDEVDLLIGLNYPNLIFATETRSPKNIAGPKAGLTPLGWYVGGPMTIADPPPTAPDEGQYCNFLNTGEAEVLQRLEESIDRLWKMESPDLLKEKVEMSGEDKRVINEWEENLHHDGKQYHLPIPFKDREIDLPDNYEQALQWLVSLGKRLEKDPKLLGKYNKAMQKYIQQGIAELVPEEELKGPKGKTWYLPHHFVWKKYADKENDLPRIVFNAAAKFFGTSLNDFILPGPDLMNLLIHVLLKFRQDRVALQGDIEGMFNQILVALRDRDCLRFFYWEDGIPGNKVLVYRMRTHLFGGIWSPSCANFTLKQVAKDFGDNFSPETVKVLKERFYVDDGLTVSSTAQKSAATMSELSQLLARGGFNFTKIASNSAEVMETVPEEKRVKELARQSLEFGYDDVKMVLGCGWKPRADKFVFPFEAPDKPSTRRGVLSTVSSLYDPLGLAAPVVVKARLVFQDSCRRKLTWDDPLEEDLQEVWDTWKASLESMDRLEFERCFLPTGVSLDDDVEFDLHLFGDSSQAAFGAVAYVRTISKGEVLGVALLMSKGRLAPIKPLSIPRLELSAAETAVLLELLLKRALDIEIKATTFWTDSMIVLWYIYNQSKRYKTFVSNKVTFITTHTKSVQWRHVPTDQNPADLISRGVTPAELAGSRLWAHGPDFLLLGPEKWPRSVLEPEVDAQLLEVKRDQVSCSVTLEEYMEVENPEEQVNSVRAEKEPRETVETYLNHWSCWYKARRNLVYYKKIAKWYLSKKRKVLSEEKIRELQGRISTEDLASASWGIIKYLQRSLYNNRGEIRPEHHKLLPIVKEGLVRVGGRLSRAGLQQGQQNPILLPTSTVAESIVRRYHLTEGHGNPQRVWNAVRREFWIVHGMRVVRRVNGSCLVCKKLKVPLMKPLMDDLHELRVTGEERPFFNTGIDYFGPLLIKSGRVERKRYGCLMTCLQTRAVHLELAWSLDMDSCVNAVLRFASRRGMPRNIRSDRGTNLVGAQKQMTAAISTWNESVVTNEFLKRGCNWEFNTPTASHMGGAWERMIRSVRAIIMTLTQEQLMSEETLLTAFCVIEDMVNNRPITPVSHNVRDLTALTPNHFLRLDTAIQMPATLSDARDAYARRWLQVQHVSNVFWRRWREEYLPTLQIRAKWRKQQDNLRVGDLVVLVDDYDIVRECGINIRSVL